LIRDWYSISVLTRYPSSAATSTIISAVEFIQRPAAQATRTTILIYVVYYFLEAPVDVTSFGSWISVTVHEAVEIFERSTVCSCFLEEENTVCITTNIPVEIIEKQIAKSATIARIFVFLSLFIIIYF
jgi:hypothetical protein